MRPSIDNRFDNYDYQPDNISQVSFASSSSNQTIAFFAGNIHEITVAPECKTGSTFVDLLAPPYDRLVGERTVSYYKIVGQSYSERLSDNVTWLLRIAEPNDYWCASVAYSGPELSDRILAED